MLNCTCTNIYGNMKKYLIVYRENDVKKEKEIDTVALYFILFILFFCQAKPSRPTD